MSEKYEAWIITFFTPALLIVVACLQMFLAQTQGLTPWKGGGFGMFSTVDSGEARFLRIYLVAENQTTPVVLPQTQSYAHLESEIRHFPRQALLDQLAVKLATETWLPGDYNAFDDEPVNPQADGRPEFRVAFEGEPVPESGPVAVQEIRVEVWRYQFHGKTGLIKAYKYMETQQPALRIER